LPVLANVLIRKTGKALQLTTSDLEIQIRTTAEMDGDAGDFTTTVGARKLIDILRTMPSDQTVSLESSQSKLILKGGKSKFTLQTLPAEDFPLVQEAASFGPVFSVPQKTLKQLLSQVSFAMAVHDIRYYLNGILFVAEGKQLSLVSTDGHRLAFACATLDTDVPNKQEDDIAAQNSARNAALAQRCRRCDRHAVCQQPSQVQFWWHGVCDQTR